MTAKVKPKAKSAAKRGSVLVNFILDCTGSMQDVWDETIVGFNNYLHSLGKHKSEEYLFTLTLFNSTKIEQRHVATPLAQVGKLNRTNYIPDAYTPLYDAIGKTIREVERGESKLKTSKVLTVIMTDGHENSSREWTKDRIRSLIEDKQKAGWMFIYLGATLDAMDIGTGLGVPSQTTAAYSHATTAQAFSIVGNATHSYVSTGSAAISDKDRKTLCPAKGTS